MDRRLKNLLQMYKWLGSSILIEQSVLNKFAKETWEYKQADIRLSEHCKQYELIKQILIER